MHAPHMVEMVFNSLRVATLPAERPQDDKGTAMSQRSARISGQKRSGGGDSSDEEDGRMTGGYGSQFRSRQRARQMAAGGGDLGESAS